MVQNPIIYKQIMEIINRARHPLFIAHKKPDGDTLGSVCAFIHYCLEQGKKFSAFCADVPQLNFRYLPGLEYLSHNPEEILNCPIDVIVVLDSGDLEYAGVTDLVHELKLKNKPVIINIDHHKTNEFFADHDLVITEAASTTEIIANIFHANGIRLSKEISTCLLTGIVTDTGGFSNPATSYSVVGEAGHLLVRGARFNQINDSITKNKSVSTLRLWGRVLARIKNNQKWGIACTAITLQDLKDFEVDEEAIEGIANFLNSLTGVTATLVLKELPDGKVKGSFRTTHELADVSKLAKICGGGGHKKAAGFTIQGKLCLDGHSWRVE